MYCISTNALSPKIVNPGAMMSWPGSASFIPNSDVTQAVKSDAHPECVMSAHLNLHLASERASSNKLVFPVAMKRTLAYANIQAILFGSWFVHTSIPSKVRQQQLKNAELI
jgi:hypothetical protein